MISQADATIGPTNTTTNISPHHHHLSHHHHHHNHHHDLHSNLHPQPTKSPQPNQLIAHNGKNTTKPFTGVIKKRKRFEENIVDGFAFVSFKTWEDLQDELNETSTLANINSNANNNNDTTSTEAGGKSVDDNKSSSNNNKKFDNVVKKVSSKVKHNKSSGNNNKSNPSLATGNNSVSTSTTSSATSTSDSTKDSGSSSLSSKKKDKSKKSNSQTQSLSPKEKRNKTSSSNKDSLKKALEAKDLAEKQLSIVQEQLKKEQNKNRFQDQVSDPKTNPVNSNTNNPNESDTTVTKQSINTDNYTQNYNVSTPRPVHNQFDHNAQSTRTNEVFGHDLMKDPSLLHKQNVYPPYHINPHMHRTNSIIHQSIQVHTPMSPNRIPHTQNLSQSQHPMNKHLLPANLSNQHSTLTPPPHSTVTQSNPNQTCQSLGTLPTASTNGQSHIVMPNPSLPLTTHNQKTSIHQHPQPSVTTLQQSTLNQTHQSFTRLPPHQPTTAPINPSPIHPHLMPPHMHPSAMLPYPSHQPNPLMSPMSLPYNCPPSIYITDTISRQTSIIPPPGQMLEQPTPSTAAAAAAAAAACRFNQSSVLHSITPYNPATVPTHHPPYYPSLPTERSFIEFARSYTSPGHLGYPNLMGSFPTQPPGLTANPYNFDRWPRVPMEHQRSISRYNSIYQSSTAVPDRTYTNYTSATRPPTFPAGLFPPPF